MILKFFFAFLCWVGGILSTAWLAADPGFFPAFFTTLTLLSAGFLYNDALRDRLGT